MDNETLNQFEQTIEEFLKLKEHPQSVLVKPIARGKWSIREIVGHMFYWDKFNLETMVPLMSNGTKLPPFPDLDAHNQEAVSYIDRFDSVDSIIDAFVQTRKSFIEKMAGFDDGVRFEIENEPYKFSPESFINIFVEHDAHHLKQIQQYLDKH